MFKAGFGAGPPVGLKVFRSSGAKRIARNSPEACLALTPA